MYRRSACLTSAKLLGLESLREASLDLVEKQRKKKTISSVFCYPELSKNKNIFCYGNVPSKFQIVSEQGTVGRGYVPQSKARRYRNSKVGNFPFNKYIFILII